MKAEPVSGVLVVDKPAGPTSHDIVDRVRRSLRMRRVGHTGTLDPAATGVLPVCVGKATRLARFLGEGDKVYRATVRLGFATTTDDLLGEPLGPPRQVAVGVAEVGRACEVFRGDIEQIPPAFSAKRVGGRRSYALARQGAAAPMRACRVHVHSLDVLAVEDSRVELELVCSPGTYVRALARDLGAALEVGGHLAALRRLRSGEFDLQGAVPGDALSVDLRLELKPLSRLLARLPAVTVGPRGREALRHGRALSEELVGEGFPGPEPPSRLRVLDSQSGVLLALAVPRGFGPGAPGLPRQPTLQPDVVLIE